MIRDTCWNRIRIRNLLEEFVHFLTYLGQDLTVLIEQLKTGKNVNGKNLADKTIK